MRIEKDYYINGNLSIEKYLDDEDILFKTVDYYESGMSIFRISYYNKNIEFHSDDAPTVINYNQNNTIVCLKYYKNGRLHRNDGPALINYDLNMNITWCSYYLNHIELNESEIIKLERNNKFKALKTFDDSII